MTFMKKCSITILVIQLFLSRTVVASSVFSSSSASMSSNEKQRLKLKTLEMFDHAYGAYKKYAFPADELMPLSCKGRFRGSEQDRGDIDEALGNFSLTLVDTLDTLVVLGKLDEFDKQVRYVIQNVSFNADAVVSVFETNIRVLGGLLGAHSVAVTLKQTGKAMLWYQDELLTKAIDIADRLLAAFNTTTGIPYPKVNLRYGINHLKSRVGHETDTCTACAGTMIMEFGALSRLTGNSIYEDKAHRAMEALWKYRSIHSDLVGTTINIHSGDWTRRDSGIGAGIDSYYEYCLKAYILLGDESYLEKFNKHYAAITRYIRQGYMFIDVLMHQPEQPIRSFMDSLQAFWPGLQVLKGDLKSAIETHEVLYTVAKKYNFLPEAFTTNFDLHWAQHPLRPEFVESTYFLYQATKDPYYLNVGKHVIESLDRYARVPCGFAALKDLRTLNHEDKMDSFVLAETFKYLYLLFSEDSEHAINIHDFIFTTEAHLLPLYLSTRQNARQTVKSSTINKRDGKFSIPSEQNNNDHTSCPNNGYSSRNLRSFAEMVRANVNIDGALSQVPYCGGVNIKKTSATEKILAEIKLRTSTRPRQLTASQFQIGNKDHINILKALGITLTKAADGKLQLTHQAALAATTMDAEEGIQFMQEMIQLAKQKGEQQGNVFQPRIVKLLSPPYNGDVVLEAGSAQFGADLAQNKFGLSAEVIETIPYRACQSASNGAEINNRIALIERGDCMFIDKVRLAQAFGALGVIIVDHTEGTSAQTSQQFGMSGDGNPADVFIPSVFLFKKEGDQLRKYMKESADSGLLEVRLHAKPAGESGDSDQTESVPSTPPLSKPGKDEPYPAQTSRDVDSTKLFGDTSTSPPLQEVHIDSQGRKVTTSIHKFIGPGSNGATTHFIQKSVETCPTVDCKEGASIRSYILKQELPSLEKVTIADVEKEKTAQLSDEDDSRQTENEKGVREPITVNPVKENSDIENGNKENIGNINVEQVTEDFLDSFVSENLKGKLNEYDEHSSRKDEFKLMNKKVQKAVQEALKGTGDQDDVDRSLVENTGDELTNENLETGRTKEKSTV